MQKTIYAMMTAVLAVNFSGCATTDDPRAGGFFNGISGLSTGAYQRRIDVRESELGAQESVHNDLLRQAEQVRIEREQVRRQLDQANGRLSRLQRSVRDYRNQLRKQQNLRAADRNRLRRIEADANQLETLIKQAKHEDRPVDEARSQVSDIQTRLAKLDSLVLELSSDAIQ